MSWWAALLAMLLLLFLSAMFSGSETGVYSLSRVRLDADARAGRRAARLLRRLVANDTGLLITLLIGNNLMLELVTHLAHGQVGTLSSLPEWTHEILITLLLTPIVFVFGELVPKDVFRRRPHLFLGVFAPLLALARAVFYPLAWPLLAFSGALERVMGVKDHDLARALGREEMLEILSEGTREGSLEPHAEELARNVLVLRETPVSNIMIPWDDACTVDLDGADADVRTSIEEAEFSRLPALRKVEESEGQRVVGYVNQLDVLGDESARPDAGLRPIPSLPATLPVDRALARMRLSGQRLALVGPPETPLGLVSVMDLLATISGDPAA